MEGRSSSRPRLGDNNFILTEKHLNQRDLNTMKHQYDDLGSAALVRLQELSLQSGTEKRMDLFASLCEHNEDPALTKFWNQVHTVPKWVHWSQIERGQKVFWRYGFANLVGFAMQGFMGGNAATPSIAEVLVRTGGFSTNVVLRRALETFQGLLQTTRCLDDLRPGGEGHTSLVRVRLLHASVRQRILKLSKSSPEYFDTQEYGIPINTCDDVHTIALFACNPLWLELPAMGLRPRDSEIEDYIALFRYVAYVLGVPNHFFASAAGAKQTMEAFCVLECRATETSRILCYNFVAALKDVPPVNLSAGFIQAASRAINGEGVSDALGIGRPGWMHMATFCGFCWLARFLVAMQRLLPSFDEYMINIQRDLLYTYIVQGHGSEFCLGGPSKFDIKHIPRIGKQTTRKESKVKKPGIIPRLEWLFLVVFVLGCCLGIGVCLLAWKTSEVILQRLPS